MRQRLNAKNTRKLQRVTGLPIHHVVVRGDTNHRQDLCLMDGSIIYRDTHGGLSQAPLRWKPVDQKDY
jgi:hypothetical protein